MSNWHTGETVVITRARKRRREVAHCELFESIDALLDATRDFFNRNNRKPGGVRSIIGAHAT